jgi:ubiquitin carboxyl-terminal hydrolase 5/13
LQLEQNLKFDFSMVADDGKQLEAVHGAGLTGLKNLGNSCYISSSVQSLFLLEKFREKYFDGAAEHVNKCQRDCSSCFVCQVSKLSTGLWDGKKRVISPWMFKSVTTSGHAEFSTARQQDASEFLSYIFKVIQRSDPDNAQALVAPFTFGQQQELTCASCGDTRFQQSKSTMLSLQISNVLASSDDNVTVSDQLHLAQFLEKTFSPDHVEAKCNKCGANEKNKCIKMTNAPEYLVMSLSRYVMRNWVPQKIDMSVTVPFRDLDIFPFIGTAMGTVVEEEPNVDETVLMELVGMGFPLAKCKKAIIETGNTGSEAAMNWIFEHMDDVVEDGIIQNEGLNQASSVSPESIQMLVDAGFSKEKATLALKETGGDVERAFDWILSHPDNVEGAANSTDLEGSAGLTKYNLVAFISHKGPSVHCGHYIAHVKDTTGRWIMFNDERVVVADPQPPAAAAEKAYVYIYQRQKQ